MGIGAIGGGMAVGSAGGADPLSLLDVTVTKSDLLPVGPFDVVALPVAVSVALELASMPFAPMKLAGWSVHAMALRSAVIDLDGYRLFVDDAEASLTLENLQSGYSSRIWGQAAGFEAGGAAVGQFWGTISLQLANDMLITCETSRAADLSNAYFLDALTITSGDNALIVKGIGGSESSDLSFTGSTARPNADEAVSDGLVLVESATGWLTEEMTGPADAAYLALTAVGDAYEPGNPAWSLREFGRVIATFSRMLTSAIAANTNTTMYDVMREQARDTTRDLHRNSEMNAAQLRADIRMAEIKRAGTNAAYQHRSSPDLSSAPLR